MCGMQKTMIGYLDSSVIVYMHLFNEAKELERLEQMRACVYTFQYTFTFII